MKTEAVRAIVTSLNNADVRSWEVLRSRRMVTYVIPKTLIW